MEDNQKTQLLDQFRAYLEQADRTAAADVGEDQDEQRQTDLFSLFVELAALKNEVKLESRQVKSALDEFKSVFDLLRTGQTQLGSELERRRDAEQTQTKAALRPLLLELLELYDRLEAGARASQGYRMAAQNDQSALLDAIAEAQEISLRRMQQLLSGQRIVELPVADKTLDPRTMRAVEVGFEPGLGPGAVIEELRKGFVWDDELLRAAEVKVNKPPEAPAHKSMAGGLWAKLNPFRRRRSA